jgi:hypothetical protein
MKQTRQRQRLGDESRGFERGWSPALAGFTPSSPPNRLEAPKYGSPAVALTMQELSLVPNNGGNDTQDGSEGMR